MIYLICMHLAQPDRNKYIPLKNYLHLFPRWMNYIDDTYIIKCAPIDLTALHSRILSEIDSHTDSFFILEDVKFDTVQGWLPKAAWQWFDENIIKVKGEQVDLLQNKLQKMAEEWIRKELMDKIKNGEFGKALGGLLSGVKETIDKTETNEINGIPVKTRGVTIGNIPALLKGDKFSLNAVLSLKINSIFGDYEVEVKYPDPDGKYVKVSVN